MPMEQTCKEAAIVACRKLKEWTDVLLATIEDVTDQLVELSRNIYVTSNCI